jgi:hypothetical protein
MDYAPGLVAENANCGTSLRDIRRRRIFIRSKSSKGSCLSDPWTQIIRMADCGLQGYE